MEMTTSPPQTGRASGQASSHLRFNSSYKSGNATFNCHKFRIHPMVYPARRATTSQIQLTIFRTSIHLRAAMGAILVPVQDWRTDTGNSNDELAFATNVLNIEVSLFIVSTNPPPLPCWNILFKYNPFISEIVLWKMFLKRPNALIYPWNILRIADTFTILKRDIQFISLGNGCRHNHSSESIFDPQLGQYLYNQGAADASVQKLQQEQTQKPS
jgi:hypothetical protein